MGLLNNTRNVNRLIANGKISISVYGLGHVGAPVAAVWLRAGARVIGVDKSDSVVKAASSGSLLISEPGVVPALKKGLRNKRFTATTDAAQASKESDLKIITVPVGLSNNYTDLSAIEDVANKVGKGLKKGDLVSLNTTVPPGTTEEFLLPILEKKSNLTCEKDFGLVYTPERIYEGRAIKDMEENYPIVIAGKGKRSLKAGMTLYSKITKKGILVMSSIRAAETEKVLEGIYRDANIALANELAKICDGLGIDYWEVRKAANSQPFCNLHKPGTGVGGVCIPIYPHFIIEAADNNKTTSDMIKLGRTINSSMPKYCVTAAIELLQKTGKPAKDANIAVLGLAFRGGVDDARLSPSYDVINELVRLGCSIRVHDPLVRKNSNVPTSVTFTNKLEDAVKDVDLIIISTDHQQYQSLTKQKLSQYTSKPLVVYDGRGILDKSKFKDIFFAGIGRP